MIGLRSNDVSLIDMSVLARWKIRPRLMGVPGRRQRRRSTGSATGSCRCRSTRRRCTSKDVTLTQVIETTGNALWVSPLTFVEASTPGTGGFVETPNQRLAVQHVLPITTAEQPGGRSRSRAPRPARPARRRRHVVEDHQPLIGDAVTAGEPGLFLVVEKFPDADIEQVTKDVEDALDALSPGLTGHHHRHRRCTGRRPTWSRRPTASGSSPSWAWRSCCSSSGC